MKKNFYLIAVLFCLLIFTAHAKASLYATVYEGYQVDSITGDITFSGLPVLGTFEDATIDHWNGSAFYSWSPFGRNNYYSVHWSGFLKTDLSGTYDFRVTADDGVQVLLNSDLVLNYPYGQWFGVTSNSFDLQNGYTPIEILFFEIAGNDGIRLEWQTPGSNQWEIIPASQLSLTAVPIPAPLWLFCSALLSFVGFGRWKST